MNTAKIRRLVIFALLAAFVLAAAPAPALAWTATVENPTQYKVRVKVWRWLNGIDIENDGWQYLEPGESYTRDTGSACLNLISGQLKANGNWVELRTMGCAGRELPGPSAEGGLCCWNIRYAVCQKDGFGYTEIRHKDFGFCKK